MSVRISVNSLQMLLHDYYMNFKKYEYTDYDTNVVLRHVSGHVFIPRVFSFPISSTTSALTGHQVRAIL